MVDEGEVLETWRAYYEKLSNEEFPWDKEPLAVADAPGGPCEKFTTAEVVQAAIKKMKSNKAAGPSGVVSDMLKAAGTICFSMNKCFCREIAISVKKAVTSTELHCIQFCRLLMMFSCCAEHVLGRPIGSINYYSRQFRSICDKNII